MLYHVVAVLGTLIGSAGQFRRRSLRSTEAPRPASVMIRVPGFSRFGRGGYHDDRLGRSLVDFTEQSF